MSLATTLTVARRYQYKGESHAYHGGVKVTYKDRLSRVGSHLQSEYGPIQTISVPGPTFGSAQVTKEQETPEGVVFIPRPPDLRKEPMREEWREEKIGEAEKACTLQEGPASSPQVRPELGGMQRVARLGVLPWKVQDGQQEEQGPKPTFH